MTKEILPRMAQAEAILSHLEKFAKALHKTDEAEGLLEFYSRKHYAQGLQDGRSLDPLAALIGKRSPQGAYISRPGVVHVYGCKYTRMGKSFGPCTCGGAELEAEIDKILGPHPHLLKPKPSEDDGTEKW